MLHDDLYAWLKANGTVDALFPGGIHHMSIPQDVTTWPAMAFQQVSRSEFADDMESPNDAKIDLVTYQFAITATNSADAIQAADTFNGIFRNFRGTMTATNIQWVSVGNIQHLEERQGDKLRRRVILDYSIYFDV